MKSKKLMAIFCASAMALSLTGCGGSGSSSSSSATTAASGGEAAAPAADEKSFNIDLATGYAADGPAGVALAEFVKDVEEKSGGSIKINLFTDGTLGSVNDNYASIASGDLDMTMAGLEGLDMYAPEYTFLDSPFLMQSEDHLKAVLNSGIGDTLKERYAENGFVTLGWHQRDVRQLASNKQVVGPADVSGLKLRLPGQTVYVDTWSALNVSTTTVAMNELYTALQTKVAEACEGGYEQMTTLKLYEVQNYIAESEHVYEFVGLFINKDLYDSMSDNQKQVLQSCADAALASADAMVVEKRAEYKQTCLDGGMEFVEIDREAFRAALEDFYKSQFESKWTVTTYDEVMSYTK